MSQPSFGNAGSAWLHSTGVVIHRMIVQQNQAATVIFEISSVWRCTSSCCYERYNSLCPDNSVIFSLPLEKCCVIGILKKKSWSCLLLRASFQNRNGLKDWPNKWGLIQWDWISISVSEWWRENHSEGWNEQKCWILPTCKAVFEKQTF